MESSLNEITEIKEKMQLLKNGYNQLKGEQGRPDIQKKSKKNQDYSSVKERKSIEPKQRKGRGKRNDKVQNLREEICYFPKDQLPPDAQFKGYVNVIVQDLNVTSDNICFKSALRLKRFILPLTRKLIGLRDRPDLKENLAPGLLL